mmetsp:Transcript_10791/g.23547  ORF Transcript_10791/g.23547 Transcript_10791/m.23547 type:complete len:248 (+) Transcript_10791:1255-1998(+)
MVIGTAATSVPVCCVLRRAAAKSAGVGGAQEEDGELEGATGARVPVGGSCNALSSKVAGAGAPANAMKGGTSMGAFALGERRITGVLGQLAAFTGPRSPPKGSSRTPETSLSRHPGGSAASGSERDRCGELRVTASGGRGGAGAGRRAGEGGGISKGTDICFFPTFRESTSPAGSAELKGTIVSAPCNVKWKGAPPRPILESTAEDNDAESHASQSSNLQLSLPYSIDTSLQPNPAISDAVVGVVGM